MNKLILATSEFCGPCKTIKQYIKDKSFDVEIKDMEQDFSFFKEYNIRAVPVLIHGTERYSGTTNIIEFLNSTKVSP